MGILKTAISVGAGSPKSLTQIKQSDKPALHSPILHQHLIHKLMVNLYFLSGGGGFRRLLIFSIDGW